jgi:hypothetical protein
VVVAHGAEAPVGQSATTDTHQVHDPVAGRQSSGRVIWQRIGMLLQSKKPQPRPKRIKKTTATPSRPVWGDPAAPVGGFQPASQTCGPFRKSATPVASVAQGRRAPCERTA